MNQASVFRNSSGRPTRATSLWASMACLGRCEPQRGMAARWNRWLVAAVYTGVAALPNAIAASAPVSDTLVQRLVRGQSVDVIVEFDGSAAREKARAMRQAQNLTHDDAQILAERALQYRRTKAAVERAVLLSGATTDARVLRDYPHLPMAFWQLASPAALARLRAHPAFRAVYEDRRIFAVQTPSDLALINQPATTAAGAIGSGTTVEVIDAGVDLTNSAFGNCPSAGAPGCRVVSDQIYYPGTTTDVAHGTNVSGVVAEVAPATNIAMQNIFNGASANSSDLISAVDWGIANQAAYNVVAMNMSLGDGGDYTSQCTSVGGGANPLTTPASAAADAGIQTVAASGNNAYSNGINWPACTPGVVSVGAVYDSNVGSVTYSISPSPCTDATTTADQVACFSNVASFLTLFAPGVDVTAAGITMTGTSQATPHVSGAFATLRARYPKEPLSQALTRLTLTGTGDTRGSISIPRINMLAALDAGAQLLLTGSGPSSATAGSTSSYTLTVKNSGPLIATDVSVSDALPALATFLPSSSSSACSASGSTVICQIASLAVNASTSFTIAVRWSGSGAAYDTASASSDQIDPSVGQSSIAFGTAPPAGDDNTPLPPWSLVLMGIGMALFLLRPSRAT